MRWVLSFSLFENLQARLMLCYSRRLSLWQFREVILMLNFLCVCLVLCLCSWWLRSDSRFLGWRRHRCVSVFWAVMSLIVHLTLLLQKCIKVWVSISPVHFSVAKISVLAWCLAWCHLWRHLWCRGKWWTVFSVCMCSAFRTPICRAKRGGFKDTFPEDLLAPVLKVKFRL